MKKVLFIAAALVIAFTAAAQPQGQGPQGPDNGQFRGPRNEEMEEFMEKQNEKRDKEYSKILTPEQYQRWKSVETEREFRRMIE